MPTHHATFSGKGGGRRCASNVPAARISILNVGTLKTASNLRRRTSFPCRLDHKIPTSLLVVHGGWQTCPRSWRPDKKGKPANNTRVAGSERESRLVGVGAKYKETRATSMMCRTATDQVVEVHSTRERYLTTTVSRECGSCSTY